MTGTLFPNVHKIALFRATMLGDLVFALPAIDALRAAYPQAELVYLGRAWHTGFLPGRLPGPHQVIAVPPAPTHELIVRGLVIDPAAEPDFYRRMQAERFDLALQMHGAGEYSNPFVLGLGARHTAGLKSARAAPLERWVPYVYYQHEVARMLEVVSLVGVCAASAGLQPRLKVLPADLEAAAPAFERLREPFVVIHAGSTDPRRIWSAEKFAAVADYCVGQGLQVALTGTSIEAERIRAVAEHMRAPAVNLADQLSLPGLVGLLSRAALFIGNDSGPLHLALAAGARAVGLFWVEYILNSLPLQRQNFYPVIAWQRACPRCGVSLDKAEADNPSGPCKHDVSFIDEITPASVISGVETLLSVPSLPVELSG